MIFETLSALLDIPPKSRFETDQIIKMKFNPICIYSAIFWLASTSPLALVFLLIAVNNQSHHFSSFADLLWTTWIARMKSQKQQVENVNKSDVDFCLVRQLLAFVFRIWKLGNSKQILKCFNCLTLQLTHVDSSGLLLFWDRF